MRIAILVWGSLFWDKRELATTGDWLFDGPELPVEFARISSNNRLTLVIKPDFITCRILYIISSFDNLQQARENLMEREGASNIDRIGFIDFATNTQNARPRNAFIFDIIRNWNNERNFDAVIWSDFAPNFKDSTGKDFTMPNLIEFLNGLTEPTFGLAKQYILSAPAQITTQFRRQLTEYLNEKE